MGGKLFRIIKNFSYLDFKNTFFRRYFVLIEVLTIFLTVSIYYYTSKAFVPNQNMQLNFYGADFFTYLLWGDLILRIPQYFFYSPVRHIKKAIQENTFESMLLFTGNLNTVILGLSLMEVVRELFSSFLMLTLCITFFHLQLTWANLWQSILLLMVSAPFFLGIGLLISSMVIWLEKGESFLYYLANIFAILAGVYFPVEVFPQSIQFLSSFFSPFFLFLKYNRMILGGQSIPWEIYPIALGVSIIFLFISLRLIKCVIKFKRKQGTLFVS